MIAPLLFIVPVGDKIAICDAADADRLSEVAWNLDRKGYAYGYVPARKKTVRMHRFIMEAVPFDPEIDHINHNKLDNRRGNLRFVNDSEQAQNVPYAVSAATGFRGVHDRKTGPKRFRGRLRVLGRMYVGPGRETAVEAARDYDDLVRKHYGSDFVVNFPAEAVT